MTSRKPAYRVPFRWDPDPPHYRLHNVSRESLAGVILHLHGSGVMAANVPRRIRPGEILEVRIAGYNLPLDAILVVRWFRPNGDEYLWNVGF